MIIRWGISVILFFEGVVEFIFLGLGEIFIRYFKILYRGSVWGVRCLVVGVSGFVFLGFLGLIFCRFNFIVLRFLI